LNRGLFTGAVRDHIGSLKSLFNEALRFSVDVYSSFCRNQGTMMAAAISCYVFLSVIPVVLLAVAGWGYLLGSTHDAQEIVFSYMRDFSPALAGDKGETINRLVKDLVAFRGPATWVGTLGLIWAGTGVITVLDKAINHSFGVPGFRGFFKERLLAVVLLPFMTLLFGLSVLGTGLLRTLKAFDPGIEWLRPARWTFFWALDSYVLPLLITIIAFTIIFFVLPRKHVPFRIALGGALFTACMWECTKQVFSYYVAAFAVYSSIYGSLGGLILWMFWVNASSLVTVLGAEVAAAATRRAEARRIANNIELAS